MVNDENKKRTEAEIGRLEVENHSLRQQLSALQIKNQTLWIVLVQIARRLQGHSTSIKAAVSSLLDYDIFWDESTQHEFLETIDSSVNGVSDLTAVLTLAFKVEAGNLEIKPEPHTLQEILVTTAASLTGTCPSTHLNLTMPPAGESVLVDYEYLALALTLLFQVLVSVEGVSADNIYLKAIETEGGWQLEITEVDKASIEMICDAFHHRTDRILPYEQLLPEDSLRLLTACKIFQLQHVDVNKQQAADDSFVLQLTIPFR